MQIKAYLRRTALITGVLAAVTIPATASAENLPMCQTSMLGLNIQRYPDNPSGQNHLTLVLTNTSSQECTLQGFPGVDLVGPNDPTYGPTYSVPRRSENPEPLTIAPGGSVGSDLAYVTGGADGWRPDTVSVTPPDNTTQLQVPWNSELRVLRQDGATHPGTHVGPLQSAH
ncbi:DUF4232 domain-containing protein [Nocardia sp. CA-107356]|uniref:DUF4232 domain-containing protein n=1 Tax=Nocardia sp. CA-107356 TaxID=3239972 RepID=UPI003D920EA6